jgi:hypothetical protein
MTDGVLGAVRIKARNTNCLQGFQVNQSIGSGASSGKGSREKQLTAASRCQRVRLAPRPCTSFPCTLPKPSRPKKQARLVWFALPIFKDSEQAHCA